MNSKNRQISFHKMHSLGNDFVVLDAVTTSLNPTAEQISWLADRHRGVGCDQLLIIEPPTEPEADFFFRIYNADGSEAQQCGNGTRVVALLVNQLQLSAKKELRWQSLAGEFTTRVVTEAQNPPIEKVHIESNQIDTTMTVPVLDLAAIPFNSKHAEAVTHPSNFRQFELESDDAPSVVVTPVSMGNPHGVIMVDDVLNVDVDQIGSTYTNHPAFPERANIGFCQVVDEQFIRLRVYERGAGETQACGSGACAAVVAATSLGLTQGKVKVSLPGGKLRIRWSQPGERVMMSGDAAYVYRGNVTLPIQQKSNGQQDTEESKQSAPHQHTAAPQPTTQTVSS
ncbi:MAG: diaminopimelate epimerase [Pseudomonadota bacterium]